MIAAVYLELKSDIPIQWTNATRVYNNTFNNVFNKNKHWMESAQESMKCNNDDGRISWSAFHQGKVD